MPNDSEREQLESIKLTIERTRREMNDLAAQIRSSKETIARSEKLLARLEGIVHDLEGKSS